MENIIEILEREGDDGIHRVESAMDFIVPLHLALEGCFPPRRDLEKFKSSFSSLLFGGHNFGGINVYLGDCSRYAERGRLDGFEEACWRRSFLHIIDECFMDWESVSSPELRGIFQEGVEDIDETIMDVSDDAPPIRQKNIPDWATERHWWWRAPQRQDMSEDEIRSRLEYDHWDGVQD